MSAEPPSQSDLDELGSELVELVVTNNRFQADLIRAYLEEQGINAAVFAPGGYEIAPYRVMVRFDDEHEAAELITHAEAAVEPAAGSKDDTGWDYAGEVDEHEDYDKDGSDEPFSEADGTGLERPWIAEAAQTSSRLALSSVVFGLGSITLAPFTLSEAVVGWLTMAGGAIAFALGLRARHEYTPGFAGIASALGILLGLLAVSVSAAFLAV